MKAAPDKEEQAAYAYAVRLLARREYCRNGLRNKLLLREVDDSVAERVLNRLISDGYLSERRFAEGFLRMRLVRGDHLWLAAAKARQKGVDEAVLQEVLESEYTDFDAVSACFELLEKRDATGRRFEDQRIWNKMARFLQSKGFGAQAVLTAMKMKKDVG